MSPAAEEDGNDTNRSRSFAGKRTYGFSERRLHQLQKRELYLSVCLLRNGARHCFERLRPLALARAVREEDDALAQ